MVATRDAGALPADAGVGLATLSDAARKLLLRLLEVDPQLRLRTLRQLQQTAFFMAFDIEAVRAMKISPKDILEQHFPASEESEYSDEVRAAAGTLVFADFDHFTIV